MTLRSPSKVSDFWSQVSPIRSIISRTPYSSSRPFYGTQYVPCGVQTTATDDHQTQTSTDPFLVHLQSLLTYSHANRAVLRLRDQKQLDFEELSDYLSGVTSERDRLAAVISGHAGSTGLGLGAYLKDRVDALRGADDDRSRVEKMRKLDVKIKEVILVFNTTLSSLNSFHDQLQDAVTTAHETSDAFSDETLREQAIFQHAKEAEMKEMLGNLADGQIEFYKSVGQAVLVL